MSFDVLGQTWMKMLPKKNVCTYIPDLFYFYFRDNNDFCKIELVSQTVGWHMRVGWKATRRTGNGSSFRKMLEDEHEAFPSHHPTIRIITLNHRYIKWWSLRHISVILDILIKHKNEVVYFFHWIRWLYLILEISMERHKASPLNWNNNREIIWMREESLITINHCNTETTGVIQVCSLISIYYN